MLLINSLALFWGFSLVIVGLAYLLNPRLATRVMSLIEDDAVLAVTGMVGVMLGIALILTYNVLDNSWRVIISILAWAVFVKGASRLFFPDAVKDLWQRIKTREDWMAYWLIAVVILGCFLIYQGFNA